MGVARTGNENGRQSSIKRVDRPLPTMSQRARYWCALWRSRMSGRCEVVIVTGPVRRLGLLADDKRKDLC